MKDQIDYLVEAIRLLRPNSEFVLTNDDYSTIKWNVLEGKAPTQAEVDEAIEQVKADEITKAAAKAAEKAALLERLGITQEEANLLLG
jgi:hypothetical protein